MEPISQNIHPKPRIRKLAHMWVAECGKHAGMHNTPILAYKTLLKNVEKARLENVR